MTPPTSTFQQVPLRATHTRLPHDDEDEELGVLGLNERKVSSRVHMSRTVLFRGRKLLLSLLPSFVLPLTRKQHVVNREQLSPTAYLDGIRGFAAFCVFWSHTFPGLIPLGPGGNIENGYLSTPVDNSVFQLPFIRLLVSGSFMVEIFFVLSGYVLSMRLLQLAQLASLDAFAKSLASAVFRRALRLYLPCIFWTFVTVFFVYFGLGPPTATEAPQATLWDQLLEWPSVVLGMVNPFRWNHDPVHYNPHLWTINVEFRCSLIVFLLCAGLARTKRWIRFAILLSLIYYCMSVKSWDVSLFLWGMILAEAAIIRRSSEEKDFQRRLEKFNVFLPMSIFRLGRGALCIALFILALWIGSYPAFLAEKTFGYGTLSRLTPSQYCGGDEVERGKYWDFWAATLLLTATENYKPLQRPFTTQLMQYLGSISFSLYIVHVAMVHAFGNRMNFAIVGYGPREDRSWFSVFFAQLAFIPLAIWGGDLFWRGIDVRCVRWAREIFSWCERSAPGAPLQEVVEGGELPLVMQRMPML